MDEIKLYKEMLQEVLKNPDVRLGPDAYVTTRAVYSTPDLTRLQYRCFLNSLADTNGINSYGQKIVTLLEETYEKDIPFKGRDYLMVSLYRMFEDTYFEVLVPLGVPITIRDGNKVTVRIMAMETFEDKSIFPIVSDMQKRRLLDYRPFELRDAPLMLNWKWMSQQFREKTFGV